MRDRAEFPSAETSGDAEAAAPSGHFVAGDPLRGIAAASVVVYHVAFQTTLEFDLRRPADWDVFGVAGPVLRNLDLGLYIFFVLSGYLIARPFVRAFVTGDAHPRLGPYLRNRALRIVPAFWAILTILLLRHGSLGSTPGELAAMYGFGQAYAESPVTYLIGPAWTLHLEVVFYMLIPAAAWLAIKAGGRRTGPAGRRLIVAGALAVTWAGTLVATEMGPETFAFQRSPASMMCAFVPGVLLALVELPLPGATARRIPRWVPLALAGAGLTVSWLYIAELGDRFGFEPTAGAAPRALATVASGLLVAAPLVLQWRGAPAWRAFDNGALRWLGRHSYSVYLIHGGILLELDSALGRVGDPTSTAATTLAVLIPLLLAASWASYRLFEAPFLRRRHAWRT